MRWDELTPSDFIKARDAAGGVCVLPVASIERHGGHLPLGTDSFAAEAICRSASKLEPMLWFPALKLAINGEATANPGSIALKTETLVSLLENLCEEIARNGCHKILLFSCHGGNGYGLPFFVQQWVTKIHDFECIPYYYTYSYGNVEPKMPRIQVKSPGSHGGQFETSAIMSARSDLVKLDQMLPDSAAEKLNRLDKHIKHGIYGTMGWYGNYPNHWSGVATGASKELGDEILAERVAKLVEAVRLIRADEETPRLRREFYERRNKGGTL